MGHVMEQGRAIDEILLVDDDPILCAIVERHFQKRGAGRVTSASDGVQALRILDEEQFDPGFLLCDLNMPNMDGIEFLRHLEQRNFNGAIAILSGEDDSVISLAESLARAHALNVVGKIRKPLKADELDDLISQAQRKLSAASQKSDQTLTADELRNAIAAGQIIAFHQPKVHAQSGAFVGTEALARWNHPEMGIIPPSLFITLAEENGLIAALTDAVLKDALAQVQNWKFRNVVASCSINLSPDVLTNIDLPDELSARVDAAGLDRRQIIFEITEGSLLLKDAVPMEVLARLRLKGFDLSVDDFCTGHSNIETLRSFPFSELKIDRSFVSAMLDDSFAAESVRASVELAKQLDLRLVAEGVETQKVCDEVRKMGIDHIQGFLFGKPMPGEELIQWLMGYRTA